MKKTWNVIRNLLVVLVVIMAVSMMIFTVVSVNTFDQSDRDLFGYKAFIVRSDSMSATDFAAGDLILVKEVDPSTLQEGDIIAFTSQNSGSYGETVTHKIRQVVTDTDGQAAFVTYGTTTDTNDESLVTWPYVLGKYAFRIPNVGSFFQFLKTTPGYILCILVPFLLLIGYQAINCFLLFRRHKKEQLAELEKEKEQLAEERRQSAEMMKELLALREQLEQKTGPKPEKPEKAEELELEDILREFGSQSHDVSSQSETT